jgi:hypothetical protein
MKKTILASLVSCLSFIWLVQPVEAQRLGSPSPLVGNPVATDSASVSGEIESATSAATVEQRIQEKQASDITESVGAKKDRLVAFLDENPIGELSWHNFVQTAIRQAVSQGLPPNIVVLFIVFPIIASIIAASRHIIGLQGFGIYIPAVLSVAFVSTGIVTGILLFMSVLLAATVFRNVIKLLKLQYLPRTALLLWGVSLSVLALLIVSTIFGFISFLTINIFPFLIIILLTENFIESQLTTSFSQAFQLTIETLIIAVGCSLLISFEQLQRFVLVWPEVTIVAVALFNILMGRYSGLRLLEYIRFRSILD